MLTLLRSNQPIAWLVVPVTALALVGVAWMRGDSAWVWGIGALAVSGAAHLIYRSFDNVDQAEPHLSWLLVGLLFIARSFAPEPTLEEDIRSWISLLIGLWSIWWILGVHRQPRVSALTFRAGALAGLAWVVEPAMIGLVVGIIIVQAKSRTPLFREWALLLLGLAWLPGLATVLTWTGRDLPAAAHLPWTALPPLHLSWSLLAGLLVLAGWLALLSDSLNAGIRRKATRTNLTLLLPLMAGVALAQCGPTPHALRLTALLIAFAWSALPPARRQRGRTALWMLALATLLAGLALGGNL